MKNNLINRIVVGLAIGIVFAAVILTSYFIDKVIFSVFLCLLIAVAVLEVRHALGERIPRQLNLLIFVFALCFGLPYFVFGFGGIVLFTLCVFVAGSAVTVLHGFSANVLQNFAFLLVYPALTLSSLFFVNSLPFGMTGVLLTVLVSCFTDMFAYFVGSAFGRHLLCPQISPKKTVEGAVGGVAGGLIGAVVTFLAVEVLQWVGPGLSLSVGVKIFYYVIIGIFGSVCTQVGDLTASLLKRNCGIKDYSRLLGSHGGVMDRVDGLMFNACFVALLFSFFAV